MGCLVNIIVLAHQSLLPENHGYARRVLGQARALCRRGHKVDIFAPAAIQKTNTTQPEEELETLSITEVPNREQSLKPLAALASSLFSGKESFALMRSALGARLRGKIDLVQVDRPYLLSAAAVLRKKGVPLVYVAHLVEQDAASDLKGWGRLTGAQYRDTVRQEQAAIEQADATLAVSEDDAARLRQLYPDTGGIEVFPNGIECDAYQGVVPYRFPRATALFLGSGFHYPNREAMWRLVRKIQPAIRRLHRDLDIAIVGAQLPTWLGEGITALGEVEDARPYILGANVCMAPVNLGSGSAMKLLEYMAASRPIVASPRAARPLGLRDGEHAILSGSDGEFAEAVVRLARDRSLAEKLGAGARARARAKYDWPVLAERLEQRYEELISECA